jgi:acyl carrier protein
MKEKIKSFIAETTFTEVEKIKDNTQLFEDGIFDSMGLLSLISFLDDEFGVKTDDAELNEENFASVEAITLFVERKKAS